MRRSAPRARSQHWPTEAPSPGRTGCSGSGCDQVLAHVVAGLPGRKTGGALVVARRSRRRPPRRAGRHGRAMPRSTACRSSVELIARLTSPSASSSLTERGQLARARLHLVEQAHVLDRDHGLVGEGLTSSISLSVNGRTTFRPAMITPIAASPRSSGTPSRCGALSWLAPRAQVNSGSSSTSGTCTVLPSSDGSAGYRCRARARMGFCATKRIELIVGSRWLAAR